jgi:hypothetical protein
VGANGFAAFYDHPEDVCRAERLDGIDHGTCLFVTALRYSISVRRVMNSCGKYKILVVPHKLNIYACSILHT